MFSSRFSGGIIGRRLLATMKPMRKDIPIPTICLDQMITPEPPRYVQETLRGLGPGCAVCFDVDSTVVVDEGIDMMAEMAGCGSEVKELTSSAMDGYTKFEDSLQARLNVIRPNLSLLKRINSRPPTFSPGVKALVEELRGSGVDVYLVSGGFRQMIEPVAVELGLNPTRNVIANTILFDNKGEFAGFDAAEPTSRSGGKAKALHQLKENNNYSKMVMIGDGITDLEARPPADIMIGYGGVVERSKVKDGADWFVTDFAEVIREL